MRNPFRARNLAPAPADQRPYVQGYVNAGAITGSTNDDAAAMHQYRGRNYGVPRVIPAIGYANGYEALQGPHFRIGYQGYIGVQSFWPMQQGEADSTIGRAIIMRPPIIPRRTVSAHAVRNAINFVQSMPYQTWRPIVPPPISRR